MKLIIERIVVVCVLVVGFHLMPGKASAEAKSVQKTVLITGANRGLGLEFARQYSERGYKVIGTARNPEKANELKALGARVVALDVTDSDSVASMAKSLDGVAIDLLINNAGVIGISQDGFEELDFDKALLTFNVNTLGPMRVTQALLENLNSGNDKIIIQISSILGSIENNSGGYYDYRGSKAALNTMNKSLSVELAADGFTSVVLHPGWVQTDLGGSGAPLKPSESIKGMLSVIDQLDTKDNGKFYDYQGNELPW